MWECQCNNCRNGGYYDPPSDDDVEDALEADAWYREQMVRDPRPLPDFTEMNDEIPF